MLARIKDKKEIAQGTLWVRFEVPGRPDFKAGQFFYITIPKLLYQDKRGNRRHFSIVNSPNEKDVIEMTTRLRDSGFKKTLQELPLGSEVEVGPIDGEFILPEETNKPLVLLAGGIGITPFISMLRWINEEQLPYSVSLIHSNRDRASAPFFEELKELAKILSEFTFVPIMTDDPAWPGEKERIDPWLVQDYIDKPEEHIFYISGPPEMVEEIYKTLREIKINPIQIKTENFSGY